MKSSSREDYLEALCKLGGIKGTCPSVAELAGLLGQDPGEVRRHLDNLVITGDIRIAGDDCIELTPSGKDTGTKVMRKHQILESFFTEMLGMKPDVASREACVLEHNVSDDTIDRLGSYIKNPPCMIEKHLRRRGRKTHNFKTLDDFDEDELVIVRQLLWHGGCNRLMDLGIFPGETIRIRRKLSNRGVVVQVKGCDIALSSEVAGMIVVEKTP
jgi:DtxR family Mn-dependent transcriptional regulator